MSRIITTIDLAANELRQGHLVAIPTETVYGLAADATNSEAVKQIFATKSRPTNHPLIMHIGDGWDIEQWVSHVPEYAKRLMQRYWPGPLTFIFNLKENGLISERVTGGQNTIAVRCPSHPLTLELLKAFGKPVVAPSANPFGKVSPTNAQHVLKDFPHYSFYILDGGRCEIGIESTILNATNKEYGQIVREGLVNSVALQKLDNYLIPIERTNTIKAPGNLRKHYQPQKNAFYTNDIKKFYSQPALLQTSYFLHFSNLSFDKEALHYQFSEAIDKSAYEFYHRLRIADESKAQFIIMELPPDSLGWKALRDRMIKACESEWPNRKSKATYA